MHSEVEMSGEAQGTGTTGTPLTPAVSLTTPPPILRFSGRFPARASTFCQGGRAGNIQC